jgi:hybrid cluster-associated redox disulfide protein
MKKITKKMTFAELIELHPSLVEPLLNRGMHCIGCPMSQMETIEQGALAHGMNPDELVEELNKKLKEKEKKK